MATWTNVHYMHPWFKMPSHKRKSYIDLDTPESSIQHECEPSVFAPLPKRRRCDTLERRIASLSLSAVDPTTRTPTATFGQTQSQANLTSAEIYPPQPLTVPLWGHTGDILDTDIDIEEAEVDTEATEEPDRSTEDIDPTRLTVSPTLLTRLKEIEAQNNPIVPLPKPGSSMALVLFKPLTISASSEGEEKATEDDDREGKITEGRDKDTREDSDAMDVDPCNS